MSFQKLKQHPSKKMDDILYDEIIKRLNDICGSYRPGEVSPISGSGLEKSESAPLFITDTMDFAKLSDNDKYLVHALLHTFYGCGGNKNLDTNTIEKLHSKIKKMIKHEKFDKLDRVKENDKN